MQSLYNLRTGTKLMLAFASLMLGFLALLALGQNSLQQIQEAQRQLSGQDIQALERIALLDANINSERARSLAMTLVDDPAERDKRIKAVDESLREDEAALTALAQIPLPDPRFPVQLREFEQVWRQVNDHRQREVLPLLAAGKLAEARISVLGDQADRIAELRELARSLGVMVQAHTQETVQNGETLIAEQRRVLIGAGLALAALALALVWALTQVIAVPLARLTQAAERISRGELAVQQAEAATAREDEVGRLEQAFARMSQYLQGLARQAERIAQGDLSQEVRPQSEADVLGKAFAAMATNLRRLTQELHEGINVLASASQEILNTT
ncbi:MAG: HAMP domain-containing protein, partial [Gammaproteobacteria bacterium]|nr:HAMP domain-containing protein [Gammaproteobacteria bacterium]